MALLIWNEVIVRTLVEIKSDKRRFKIISNIFESKV